MRVAVKVAYDGTRFHGSQSQPGVRTVQGEVARALDRLGERDARLAWAGRTDAGVSARANVVVFETAIEIEKLLPALTYQMDDVWAWAGAEVSDSFEPRHARERWYRYHDATGVNEHAMQAFVGEHDFSAFARVEEGTNPTRTVFSVKVTPAGVDVRGANFLWNQVRRMVAAGRTMTREGIAAALAAAKPADFRTAAPEPLVLMAIDYAGVSWLEEPRVFERLDKRIAAEAAQLNVLRSVREA